MVVANRFWSLLTWTSMTWFSLFVFKTKAYHSWIDLSAGSGKFHLMGHHHALRIRYTRPNTFIKSGGRKSTHLMQLKKEQQDRGSIYIRFSRAFQRYVVFKCSVGDDSCSYHDFNNGEIIRSFIFLDEALKSFPDAVLIKLRDVVLNSEEEENFELVLGGMGLIPSREMIDECPIPSNESVTNAFEYLQSLSSMSGHRKPTSNVMPSISPQRFAAHTIESLHRNYHRVLDLLTRGRNRSYKSSSSENILFNITKIGLAFDEADARAVIAEFPQLCLYDIHDLEDRVKFFISPQWKSDEEKEDFYNILRKGFGAGLSIEQATKAIAAVPQFLSMNYEDSRKPSMIYFYSFLHIPPTSINEARSELSQYILGCDASDVCAFAYLHSLGVSWGQIRFLLDAFPTLTYSEKDPSWDLLDRSMRSELVAGMLIYLRKRLQISNDDIHSMLKVHSRLSSYGMENIRVTLDALQDRLGLSSSELRRLVLRMPSIIGIHVDNSVITSSLDKKIAFFVDEVRLGPYQLKESVMKHPSLLQYSVDTLRSKKAFLVNELAIPEESIERVIALAPVTLGLSLNENLRPTVATLKERCSLSCEELGEIIITCPTILTLSIKRKLDPCLSFLTTNLFISSSSELGALIKDAPRILLQGVDTSLGRKLCNLKDALEKESKGRIGEKEVAIKAASIIKNNPALLVTTNLILETRINKCMEDPTMSIEAEFIRRKVGRKRIFNKVKESDKNADIQSQVIGCQSKKLDVQEKCDTAITLSAHVSGSIYPKENINQARGKRRSGGLAILLPQLHNTGFEFDFISATKMSFGMTMPQDDGAVKQSNELVRVGFPFLRPSRNRCDLYACHGALKLVLQLLKQIAAKKDVQYTEVSVKIYTDSSYAWKLLKNSTTLDRWGAGSSAEEFLYDGAGTLAMANPDLLFPLAQNLHRMVNKKFTDYSGEKVTIGDIKIDFYHSGDDQLSYEYIRELNLHSTNAAKWQFDKG